VNNPYKPPDFDDDRPLSPEVNRHVGSDYNEAREFWPRCPQCNKRLTVTCPICQTTDNLFPLADVEFWDDRLGGSLVEHQRKVDQLVAARSVLFGEGNTTLPFGRQRQKYHVQPAIPALPYCGSVTEADDGNTDADNTDDNMDDHTDDDDALDDHATCHHDHSCQDACQCNHSSQCESSQTSGKTDDGEAKEETEELPFVVLCPTCSEPFVPDFPSRCKHCGCFLGDKKDENDENTDSRGPAGDTENDAENGDPTRLNNLQLAIILILAIASIFMLVFVRIFVLRIGFNG